LWGGFSVDDATLNRFFSLHFFFPFVILMVSLIHIMLLHEFGSNNPSGVFFRSDFTFMTPLYIIKDLFGTNFLFIFLAYLVFVSPDLLGHTDNYILSNPLVTPPHIVPE
jgi:quinol-cytochrome oxidoreductase complex cytochrome b subunit